jgi:hypothetical protein
VSTPVYFTLWLLAALLAIGFLSAYIARHRRLRTLRRQQAVRMMGALRRYSEWVASQRRATGFTGESAEAAQALDEAATLRIGWFPELAGDMAEVLAEHNRLMQFLATQNALRLQDPEAWLESDHDNRFMALWRQQVYAMQAMREKLKLLDTLDSEPPSVMPDTSGDTPPPPSTGHTAFP